MIKVIDKLICWGNSVYKYLEDGSKEKVLTLKKPKTKYISKEKVLYDYYSLSIVECGEIYYLVNHHGEKLVRIYSKSKTHIIERLNKLVGRNIIVLKSSEDRLKYRDVVNKLHLKQCSYCLSGFKPKSNSKNNNE